jgi:hypothetical protein
VLLASAGTWLIVALPFVVTSANGRSAVLFGSGDSGSPRGTVLWQLNIHHGPVLVFLSRILPILVSVLLAWWVHERLGPRALEPIPFVSLVATSIILRLVFEQGLFGYKFMALAVLLVILDVVSGRIRGELVAWLALVIVAYNPFPYGLAFHGTSLGHFMSLVLPYVFLGVVLVLLTHDAVRRRFRPYLVACFVIGVAVFCVSPPRLMPPTWFWQVILVGSGVALAAGPLVSFIRDAADVAPIRGDVSSDLTV